MNDPRTLLKDAGYVAVGLGVIAFQRAQVRRRELEKQLADAGVQIEELRKLVEERAIAVTEQVKAAIPADMLETAVGAAKDAGCQILDLVRPNAA